MSVFTLFLSLDTLNLIIPYPSGEYESAQETWNPGPTANY